MTMPFKGFHKAGAALLVVLCAALGTSDASWLRQTKRVVRPSLRPIQGLRVERPPVRRRLPRYASDRVLVRFRPGVDEAYADGLLRSYGFPSVRRIPQIGVYSVRTAAGVSVGETLAMLRRNGDIALVRPDYRARLADVPNDSYFLSYQYNLRNIGGLIDLGGGISFQSTAGADIKATAAWDSAKGDSDTIIAIVDTGVDMTHPDLAAKLVSSGHDFANDDNDATDDCGTARTSPGSPPRTRTMPSASPASPGTAGSFRSRSPTRPATAFTAGSSTASSGRRTRAPTSSISA